VDLGSLRVPDAEIRSAAVRLRPALRQALELAAGRIRRFHSATAPPGRVDADDGLTMRREFRAVRSAGLYVPGGTAAYPSSVLMLGIPARVAGVRRVVLASPPGAGGRLPDALLYAAQLAGVDEILRVGGAQAIAALAYGTESVTPVDVIAGPGNRYVTAAKRIVSGSVGIDGLAGPSEIAVIADGSGRADWAALDVVAQLEHDRDARALIVATDAAWLEEVAGEVARAAEVSPRCEILAAALAGSAGLVTPDLEVAARIVGVFAPEHLSVLTEDPERMAAAIGVAGAIFLGPYAPVAAGDYLAGPNHTLPTAGTARFLSGLGVETFGRWVSVISGDRASLGPLIEPAATLAEEEGLPAHAASLRARLQPNEEVRPAAVSPARHETQWLAERAVAGRASSSEPAAVPPARRKSNQRLAERAAAGRERSSRAEPAPISLRLPRRLRDFEPYRAARHEATTGILLDANENPRGGFREVVDLEETLAVLGRYPDPGNVRLREAAADAFGVPAEAVFAGNGSDEAIDLLFRAFTDPGDEVVVAAPTYGMYAVQAALHGVRVREVRLGPDFRLAPEALDGVARREFRLLFVCSPNNPTGNLLGRTAILEATRRAAGLVVVDEAYVEFAEVESLAALAARPGSSLVVLRTLSKAWGLAGLRCGFAIAAPRVVEVLQRVKLPYNLSAVTVALAVRALSDRTRLERTVRENASERRRLEEGLRTLGLPALPSAANFLLVPHADARQLVQRLSREWGVVVRDRSGLPGIPSAFRVTVGSPDEDSRFLEGLARCLA
jgi:histidinol dehydrogenase